MATMNELDERLIAAFTEAAYFLRAHVRDHGWKWSSAFLYAYARCAVRASFPNTLGPAVLREVARRHPDLEVYIVVGSLRHLKARVAKEPDLLAWEPQGAAEVQ